ncbi:hypothetical protein Hanom_Chr09g00823501 [Helianthus anomalus]
MTLLRSADDDRFVGFRVRLGSGSGQTWFRLVFVCYRLRYGAGSTLVKGSFTFVRVSGIRCGQSLSKEVRDGQLQCGSGAGFTKFLAFYFKFSSHL